MNDKLTTAAAEGLSVYVGRPGLGLMATGVGLAIGSAPLSAVVLALAGGLGVIVGGFGWLVLTNRAIRLKAFADKVEALVKELKDA
ncbi:MAG: hypothetical protein WDN24_09450 [Sphingomonas sp.]